MSRPHSECFDPECFDADSLEHWVGASVLVLRREPGEEEDEEEDEGNGKEEDDDDHDDGDENEDGYSE